MLKILLIGVSSACFGIIIGFNSSAAVPDTPKLRVADEYHGIKVIDDYRWLEASDNAEVKE